MRSQILEYSLLFLIIILHICNLFLPPVNQEWAFASAVDFLETGNQIYIDAFFYHQANTLGISYLAFLLKKILPFDSLLSLRILSFISTFFVIFSIIKLKLKEEGSFKDFSILIFILANPLLWIFETRGTADTLPASLALFSISLFLLSEWKYSFLIPSAFLFGFSILLKYHSILFFLFIIFYTLPNLNLEKFFKITLYGFISLLIPLIYIYIIYQNFNFILTPPGFQTAHGVKTKDSLENLISYSAYLAILGFPYSFFVLHTYFKNLKFTFQFLNILMYSLAFILGYFLVELNGEMNFGPLEKFFSVPFLAGIFSSLFVLFVNSIYLLFKEAKTNLIKIFILFILFFIFALSFSRPAQRYLIYILPIYFYIIYKPLNKKIIYLVLLFYFLINSYISIHQYMIGSISEEICIYLQNKNLLSETEPNQLDSHSGNYFFPYKALPKNYIISHDSSTKTIQKFEKKILFLKKELYLNTK
jgi:hypothetical protein